MQCPSVETSTERSSSFYGHQQPQHQVDTVLRHHPHHQSYHLQRAATAVRDTFQVRCHDDRADAIPQFSADRRQVSTDLVVPGTSLRRTQQRQPGTSFAASHGVPELAADRACVDRYDYVLFGCEQFAKISFETCFIECMTSAAARSVSDVGRT